MHLRSRARTGAARAIAEGAFKNEIVPVKIPQRKGDPLIFDTDEHPRQTTLEKMATLRPGLQERTAPSRPGMLRASTMEPAPWSL